MSCSGYDLKFLQVVRLHSRNLRNRNYSFININSKSTRTQLLRPFKIESMGHIELFNYLIGLIINMK